MHFSTLVIAKPDEDIEEILAPYDENLECEPEIVRTKQEFINTILSQMVQTLNSKDSSSSKEISLSREKLSIEELYDTVRREEYDESEFDEEGNLIEGGYNPDGYWDWWAIGGRWTGLLRTKDGRNVDCATVEELDLDNLGKMSDEQEKLYRLAWRYKVDGDTSVLSEAKDENQAAEIKSWFWSRSKEQLQKAYGTEEKYIADCNKFSVHAFVSSKLGWLQSDWGETVGDDGKTWEESILAELAKAAPDDIVTIVDCHC